jgi:uncharacterized protein YxeA
MKKIIVISLFSLFIAASCTKLREAEYCWTCTIITITVSPGTTTTITSHETKCDMSTREMELYEQEESSSTKSVSCVKQ